ncbi:MAG: hypothetical protein IPM26_07310 [Saprospiraceae bacterium]|nr:hypothetical protein [Saprospiraceae bacterium]
MQRVSSNLTVFFKLFLPTVWIVFFGVFTLAIFLTENTQIPFLTSNIFRFSFLAFYLFFLSLIYLTLLQLKRVELGPDHYHVSNYFKTYRLYYHDIASVNIIPLGRLKIITFTLKSKSSFGRKIHFLTSSFLWNHFMDHHPHVAAHLKTLQS